MSARMILAASAASLALVLTGCASEATTASGDTTVQFLGPENPETFVPVIEAFEETHPGISIEYTQVPQDQFNSTIQQRLGAEDDGIDVYTVDQPRVSQLAAQGFLVDLTELKDDAEAAVAPDQYGVNFYNDKMWALPVWTSTQMLFYNADVLDEAGIEAPSIDPAARWTWEEIEAAGATAQEKAGIDYGFLFEQVELYYEMQQLTESLGGGSGLTGSDNLTPNIENDGWVDAMTWYADTFESGLSPRGVGGFDTGPVFSNGNVAFFVGGPWDVGIFAGSAEFDWGIAPLPYFENGEPVTATGSWSWGVSPFSKNQDAAQEFVEFASLNAEGNLATTEALTVIPSNVSAAAEYLKGFDATAGDKSAGVADLVTYEMANTAVARPSTVGFVQFEEVMNTAFADIRNGSDVESRLAQATQELEEAFAKLQ
ncbi:ABC transporter substrate-binding protein [Salinibacterium sp. SWN1162]|uniref:ABC transporter substrate-binding protein n=1 Tax=Salinibacterium sp. SWN1162 TaxID=2792053 RepID=UPI0018CCBB2E|nr:sugar ABC transporter substrate-binding protein [Salinibacterium sp. SWN1162]MBH0009953.1 sugar ABC transporter substrate-binding protein [Salinibacterium sp. SWN1162]